mmetsp:Transcript_9000/g.19326  ORF Transcript_9000/g.19326 Transcript_9000/m.19326 type:complete len:240 (-) Transcript_9000:795-1514(-)
MPACMSAYAQHTSCTPMPESPLSTGLSRARLITTACGHNVLPRPRDGYCTLCPHVWTAIRNGTRSQHPATPNDVLVNLQRIGCTSGKKLHMWQHAIVAAQGINHNKMYWTMLYAPVQCGADSAHKQASVTLISSLCHDTMQVMNCDVAMRVGRSWAEATVPPVCGAAAMGSHTQAHKDIRRTGAHDPCGSYGFKAWGFQHDRDIHKGAAAHFTTFFIDIWQPHSHGQSSGWHLAQEFEF